MTGAAAWVTVTVTQARWEADGVLSLTLTASNGEPLPDWSAGAHIDLELPSGLVRQYSLCGDPSQSAYTIAVLREPNGRGGSAEVHDTALVGRELRIRGPRNHFRLEPAEFYVFVAGGIGVTPILAMVREAADRGVPWSLHYGGRCADTMAFSRELLDQAGGDVTIRTDDRDGPLPLDEIVRGCAPGTGVYACGPAGMLRAVRTAVADLRPDLDLRTEQFTADKDAPAAPIADDAARPFEVELARSGETVVVPPGASILDAVREVRPEVMSSCEEGFCGTCETKVLAGSPIHRDTILTEREREKNTTMMICVGSCASERLVLDL